MNGAGQTLASKVAELVECVCTYLSTEGGGKPCWCGFYPGSEVSWDYCGSCSGDTCGMGYVRIVDSYQSSNFPNQETDPVRCQSPLAVQLAVGALRCMPMNEDGSLPTEAVMWEVGLAVMADMTAMLQAIDCCVDDYALGAYEPQGPQGGCVGGQWTMWISL